MQSYQAEVLYEHIGNENILTIKPGETITILQKSIGNGWSWAQKGDLKGFVPSLYIRSIDSSFRQKQSSKMKTLLSRTLQRFHERYHRSIYDCTECGKTLKSYDKFKTIFCYQCLFCHFMSDVGAFYKNLDDLFRKSCVNQFHKRIIVHFCDDKLVCILSTHIDELKNDFFDELLDKTKTYFKIKGRIGTLYTLQNDKQKTYIDDLTVLVDALYSVHTLDLYLINKNLFKKKRIQFANGIHHIDCKMEDNELSKTMIVFGETGVGKSTFLNSMINYIYNVQFEDKYRLKLIAERTKDGGQSKSQTESICRYHIKKPKGSNIDYNLNVIDTPGFGDTNGIEKDIQTMNDIALLFETNKVQSIDAICFVVKATDSRLSDAQKYAFNSMLNIWNKNVKQNIFILMTFADCSDPPVLDAIKEYGIIDDCKYFLINNSVYQTNRHQTKNRKQKIFDKRFWKMGAICFEQLFNALDQVSPISVDGSKLVLAQRMAIKSCIESLLFELNIVLLKRQQINEESKLIQSLEQEIHRYAESSYHSTEYYLNKEYQSYLSVICSVCCNKTCYSGFSGNIVNCSVMASGGYCTHCNCHYSKHMTANYKWVKKTRQILKSNWNDTPSIKHKYYELQSQVAHSKAQIDEIGSVLSEKEIKIMQILESMNHDYNELRNIALRSSMLTTDEYIDKLIVVECNIHKIEQYKKYKKMEQYIKVIEEHRMNIHLYKSAHIIDVLLKE